jgi:FlaA1/EpsC-like NDP-sugar epimerase
MITDYKKTPYQFIMIIDAINIFLAVSISFIIRFNFHFETFLKELFHNSLYQIIIYVFANILIFYLLKSYQSIIRHTSIHDVKKIISGVLISTTITLIYNFLSDFIGILHILPTSIVIMNIFTCSALLLGFRFVIKVFFAEYINKGNKNSIEKVLIYGAGVSGLITKRTIEKNANSNLQIIGFLEDNKSLVSTRLQGTKIYNSTNIESLISKHQISTLIIAIQNPNYSNTQKVIDLCIKNSIKIQKVPSAKSWINGDFSTSQIKNIKIEDLLGRNPIYLNPEKISSELDNQTILVTGAAGSIGSGLVKQLAKYSSKKIILLDQAESPLYDLEQDLIQNFTTFDYEIVIGDVSNLIRMKRVFDFYKPTIVFHAAAYKHVPLMEENPSEAIYTNILGTKNLVDLSVEYNVTKFVLISTDKAVNPTNVMGASKRIAEIYTQSSNTSKTKFITTRFGNVLGSNGSVIPLFKRQIEQGGPITITDKRVTRFFMTIPEACQLVLEAGAMGNGGEIFVFDMGESVKIIDLARKMIKLSGLQEGKDIEIKVTGLRPGEKLYEELLSHEENTIPTYHPKILIAKVRENEDSIKNEIDNLILLFNDQNNREIVKLMKKIVPEYISNNSEYESLDKKQL